jgi:hypothetical protein
LNNNSINGLNHRILFDGVATGAKGFNNSTIVGANNTASLVTNDTNGISSTGLIGQGLYVESGNASGTGGSLIVGRYNETGSLANPGQYKFIIGNGTGPTNRLTSLALDGTTNTFIFNSNTTMSGNGGFPLTVDGTINSKRLHFTGNPFNTNPSSNLGAIRLTGDNLTFYSTNYDLAEITTQSQVYQTVVTGSNLVETGLRSNNNGSDYSLSLKNQSGTGSLITNANVVITGSLNVSGGVTGSFSGDGSGLTGITASAPDNVATTGSNIFIGNQTITGSLNVSGSIHNIIGNNINITGNTQMSGNGGFPLNVDGTITSKRFNFSGNPFNSTLGGTFGSVNYDSNNVQLSLVNGDFGTPATNSAIYATTNTGSNFTNVLLAAEYGGTSAIVNLENSNGTRRFSVQTDAMTVTGSLDVTAGITGSLEGTASFATTASFALNGGGGGSAFPFTGSAQITGSLGVTGSVDVSGSVTITGSVAYDMPTVDIRTTTSGSIDLSLSNAFRVLDDTSPTGGHLTFTNHRDGQQVTILINTNGTGQIITLTGVNVITPASGDTNQITLASGNNMLQGVCFGGVFYGVFTQQ